MNRWVLAYEGFDPAAEGLREALCTLGNGYLATRGAAPEMAAGDVHYPGTYLAGVYNRLESVVADRVIENEDLVNVPNWLSLRFRIEDGPWFDPSEAELQDYVQELDLRSGVLHRRFSFRDPAGRLTSVAQRRLVSMRDPHLACQEVTFRPENWSGRLTVVAALDGTIRNAGVPRYRSLNQDHLVPVEQGGAGEEAVWLAVETSQSRIRIGEAARIRAATNGTGTPCDRRVDLRPGYAAHELVIPVVEGVPVTVEKVVGLYTSRDRAISEPALAACEVIAGAGGFDELLEGHVLAWSQLWRRFRIEAATDEWSAMVVNLHIFHLLQTVSKHTIDLDAGVPARGLHGEAYRGHIFWDELFIFPFLNLHMPDLTRSLLQYRFRRLPQARRLARVNGLDGALYPWQSSSDGREESQTVHLNPQSGRWIPDNSSLQRHVNIAIAWNVWQYYQVTADLQFLAYYGTEMLVEIARMLASLTSYNRVLDRYEIRRVMGPDEYHDAYPDASEPGLNNNAYTNVMTVWVLKRATEALSRTPAFRRRELEEKLGVRVEELERWDDIARKMLVPFHGERIISQFEGYDDLEEFDWVDYAERYGDIQRLDRILEAEGLSPNRFKVSKQADVLMLFYLLSAAELEGLFVGMGYQWDPDLIPRNIDYYMARTSHGSTLSRVVHSWVLARSDRKASWEFFQQALRSDVADIQGGTTAEGIHLGAMAGTVDLLQRGYPGLETRADMLFLNPSIPEELGELSFDVNYRRQWMRITVDGERLVVATDPGAGGSVRVGLADQVFDVAPGTTAEVPLDG